MKKIIAAIVLISGVVGFYSEQLKDNFLNSKRKYVVILTNSAANSGGTGFYLKLPSGKVVIMTNNHVCRLAENGNIIAVGNGYSAEVKVIESYENNDLCMIEAPRGMHNGLSIASSVSEGENIAVLGHPMLMPISLTKGQISGGQMVSIPQGYNMPCEGKTYRKIDADPNDLAAILFGIKSICIRDTMSVNVTANILPGNSGSPVLNAYGNVIGVAFAGSPGSGRGLIVPLEDLADFISGK